MTEPDLRSALRPVVETFTTLGIAYFVGGSVASSAYGLPRTTLDVDLVADLRRDHIDPFVEQMQDAYYVDAQMIEEAIRQQRSFNVIHLDTMLKVDVFVLKQTAYDQEAFRRAQAVTEDIPDAVVLARPEDVVLNCCGFAWEAAYRSANGEMSRACSRYKNTPWIWSTCNTGHRRWR